MRSVTVLTAVAVASWLASSAFAGDPGQYMGYYAYPQPVQYAPPVQGGPGTYYVNPNARAVRYPNLDASLYPCPRPDVPAEVGGTIITNSALYPHEMLYPHQYRALYPPFYYKRMVFWPRYELKGTEVKVKYKSCISPFSLFSPPVSTFRNY
jgi:hypothetical protein